MLNVYFLLYRSVGQSHSVFNAVDHQPSADDYVSDLPGMVADTIIQRISSSTSSASTSSSSTASTSSSGCYSKHIPSLSPQRSFMHPSKVSGSICRVTHMFQLLLFKWSAKPDWKYFLVTVFFEKKNNILLISFVYFFSRAVFGKTVTFLGHDLSRIFWIDDSKVTVIESNPCTDFFI